MSDQELTNYPFKRGLEDKVSVTLGVFSDIKEFKDDDRWIVKEYAYVTGSDMTEWVKKRKTDPNNAAEPPEMNVQIFTDGVKRSDELIEKFGQGLKRFIPEHQLIFGTNDKGEKRGFLVMKKVNGEDLEKMKAVPDELVGQLEEIIKASVEFYENSFAEPISRGYFPDLMPIQADDNARFGNLMWGELELKQGLYLIDTYPLRRYGDPKSLAVIMEVMMQIFELEKGVKFSDGFIKRMTQGIKAVGKKRW